MSLATLLPSVSVAVVCLASVWYALEALAQLSGFGVDAFQEAGFVITAMILAWRFRSQILLPGRGQPHWPKFCKEPLSDAKLDNGEHCCGALVPPAAQVAGPNTSSGIRGVGHTSAIEKLSQQLRILAIKRCFVEALAAYDQAGWKIGAGSEVIWSVLLFSSIEAGEFARCTDLIDRLLAVAPPSEHDYNNIIRYYAHCDDLESFTRVLQRISASGFHLDVITRNRALRVLTTAGSLEIAYAWMATAVDVPMDDVGYGTLMRVYARHAQAWRCQELLKEMLAKGASVCEVTFGIVLDVCVKSGDFDAAQRVFDELKRSGVEANAVHYTTFMQGLAKAGRLDDSGRLLDEMMYSASLKPDIVTYTVMIKARSDRGDIDEVLRLLKQMEEQGLKVQGMLFNIALTACCSKPMHPADILNTFERLVGRGLMPSTPTASILLKALAQNQGWSQALAVLHSWPGRFGIRLESRIFHQLERASIKAGRHHTARQVRAIAAAVKAGNQGANACLAQN